MAETHLFSWRTSKELNPNQLDEKGNKIGADASRALATWWLEPEDKAHDAVTACLDDLMSQQTNRQWRLAGWGNLYGNAQWYGGLQRSGQSSTSQPWYRTQPDIPHYNVVQSVIDWAVSKLGKDQPRVWMVSSGGDFHDWQKAIKLTYLYDGIAYECKTERKLVGLLRDGAVFGDGWIKVFARRGRVVHQRVLPSDMWFDEAGAMSGEWPRQIHQLMAMDRAKLCKLFPEKEEAIRRANPFTVSPSYPAARTSDVVLVRESWHLPSNPDSPKEETDGCHALTIEGATLMSEPWVNDWFPFVHYRWNPRMYGWCGQGISEQLRTRQSAINKLAFLIDRAAHANSMNIVALQRMSKINPEHIARNDIKNVIEFDTVPPEYMNPQPFAPEYLSLWKQYIEDCYAVVGASMMNATGVKPAGLNSGEAQRVYHDINTERFWNPAKELEDCAIDCARISIATVKQIGPGAYKVRSPQKGSVMELDAKGLIKATEGKEDPFVIRAYPASPVSESLPGRMADLSERFQVGMLSPTEYKRMQMNPDLQQIDALDTSAENRAYHSYDKATSGDMEEWGPQDFPDDRDNLQLFVEIGTQVYLMAKTKGIEDERLSRVDALISAAADLKDKHDEMAQQKAAAVAGAVPGMQTSAPQPTGISPGQIAAAPGAPPLPQQPNTPGPGMIQ